MLNKRRNNEKFARSIIIKNGKSVFNIDFWGLKCYNVINKNMKSVNKRRSRDETVENICFGTAAV